MSQAVADAVRHLRVIAVNGAYALAPWSDALVANDRRWWDANPEAKKFAGRRISSERTLAGVEHLPPDGAIASSTCSGVVALELAKRLGARRILMLGADFHGDHFFGRYTGRLGNTSTVRREVHRKQFRKWRDANPRIEVFNCTPGSVLEIFPRVTLDWALQPTEEAAA